MSPWKSIKVPENSSPTGLTDIHYDILFLLKYSRKYDEILQT